VEDIQWMVWKLHPPWSRCSLPDVWWQKFPQRVPSVKKIWFKTYHDIFCEAFICNFLLLNTRQKIINLDWLLVKKNIHLFTSFTIFWFINLLRAATPYTYFYKIHFIHFIKHRYQLKDESHTLFYEQNECGQYCSRLAH
jgi:hypothetical protein